MKYLTSLLVRRGDHSWLLSASRSWCSDVDGQGTDTWMPSVKGGERGGTEAGGPRLNPLWGLLSALLYVGWCLDPQSPATHTHTNTQACTHLPLHPRGLRCSSNIIPADYMPIPIKNSLRGSSPPWLTLTTAHCNVFNMCLFPSFPGPAASFDLVFYIFRLIRLLISRTFTSKRNRHSLVHKRITQPLTTV